MSRSSSTRAKVAPRSGIVAASTPCHASERHAAIFAGTKLGAPPAPPVQQPS